MELVLVLTLITLLTDFGLHDSYVGIMKGVIAQISPAASVIDLSHDVSPQDIQGASFQLAMAYAHFPQGTIHVVVVDPGVGSSRRAIALRHQGYGFVGPDNGVFSPLLKTLSQVQAVELNNPTYWYQSQPSRTFHGRDIFAPVAAHLSAGIDLSCLGQPVLPQSLCRSLLLSWTRQPQGARGQVQAVDRFGNLITNLPAALLEDLPPTQPWTLEIQHRSIPGHPAYSTVKVGDLLALGGSHGWLEIAVNQGSAQSRLQAKVGDRVDWVFDPLKEEKR
ncbi:SAM hydrolase/SAM-dependent halogenase family protein [Lyngbya confervoides]|uniref:SAM-dependent chlorinase/fluorinase n=1 Tax=Lyngbya confervoides BDU141951 TaxID=1574623 RepID=A0ABD4T305_9CYAN|nr:SAM-dependent chlorinase/fluorinase [Lyngbya confervoides]MCM1982868.1 SAM-dependent chlorinase/fluorinase [Lyngbya confervoides BDU141951]